MSKEDENINVYMVFAGSGDQLDLIDRFYDLVFDPEKAKQIMTRIEGQIIRTQVNREKIKKLI